jgi:elongation factor G
LELAIEPKTQADMDKLGMALSKLAEEDPTFQVHTDSETQVKQLYQVWVSFTWKLSSTVLRREFKVEVNQGAPQVSYKETITKKVANTVRPTRNKLVVVVSLPIFSLN